MKSWWAESTGGIFGSVENEQNFGFFDQQGKPWI